MKNFLLLLILLILFNTAGGIYVKIFRLPMNGLLLISLFFYLFFIQKFVCKLTLQKASLTFGIFVYVILFNWITAIPGQSVNTYAFMLIAILSAYLANLVDYNDEMLEKFYKVLIIIEIHALLTFFAYYFVQNGLQFIPNQDGEGGYQTFHYLFFYNDVSIRSVGNIIIHRNIGMFWEPGILQLFLNIALYIQLFYKKISIPKIAITIFLLFTTFSTTGLIIMIIIIGYKFKSLLTMRNFYIVLPIGLLTMSLFLPYIMENITEKTTGEHATSGYIRFFDLIQGVFIVKDYPLTGIGLSIEPLYELQQKFYKTVLGFTVGDPTGSTNSIVATFTKIGIPAALLYFYALYRQTIFTKNRGLFFLILLMTFTSEPIALRTFFIFLVIRGLMDIIGSLLPLKHKRLE